MKTTAIAISSLTLLFTASLFGAYSHAEDTPAVKSPPKVSETEDAPADAKQETKKKQAPTKVERPMLWRITPKEPGTEKTGDYYLFGTIHVPDTRVLAMHPASTRAFENADAVYTEIDLVKDAAAQAKALSLPADKKLKEVIGEDLYNRLEARIKSYIPALTVEGIGVSLIPSAWAIFLPQLELMKRYPGGQPLDAQLSMKARKANKTVAGLEDPRRQTALFTSLSDAQQIEVLTATLDELDKVEKEKLDPLGDLINMYLEGDIEKMIAYFQKEMNKDTLSKELKELFMTKMLFERNKHIAIKMDELIKAQPTKNHFFAIGAMHCMGEKKVQDTLRTLGYSWERVTSEGADAASDKKPSATEEPAPTK